MKYEAPDTGSQLIYEMLCEASRRKPALKQEMMDATGKGEREVRHVIEDMREQGVRVVGSSDRAGYYIAENEKEYQHFRRNYISKAVTIFRRVRAMDNVTDENQLDFIDVLIQEEKL